MLVLLLSCKAYVHTFNIPRGHLLPLLCCTIYLHLGDLVRCRLHRRTGKGLSKNSTRLGKSGTFLALYYLIDKGANKGRGDVLWLTAKHPNDVTRLWELIWMLTLLQNLLEKRLRRGWCDLMQLPCKACICCNWCDSCSTRLPGRDSSSLKN